jgi:predicted nucleic acid-binding protein
LLKREPNYLFAAKVNVLSEKGHICCYVSASAVTDIFYIAQKEMRNKEAAFESVKKILTTTRIASVTESNIYEALDLQWKDFEDSVQFVVGRSISADYIITRNPKDFKDSAIVAVPPDEFLKQHFSEN